MHTKKSMIEIQFHWIFLLVAGMILFLFIISLIFMQKGRAEEVVDMQIMRQITASFKGKQQISDSFTEMEIPQTTLNFDCDKDLRDFRYKMSGSQWELLPIEIMFAPKEIKGKKLILWTQDFQMPFTVTRFLYVTNPATAFIIYNTTNNANANAHAMTLFNSLPPNITKFLARDQNAVNAYVSQYKSFKVICFNGNCPSTLGKINYINIINSTSSLYYSGNVVYVPKTPPQSDPIPYVTKQGLFGAIFSDNEDYYDCQMFRAFQQFDLKRELALERIKILMNLSSSDNPLCNTILLRPRSTLERMKGVTHYNTTLMALSKSLESDNYDLDVKNCPLVY